MGLVVERSVEIDAGRVGYLEAGPATGAAVVFLHGAAFRATEWQELGILEACAARGLRAIALDLPGHGRSDPSARQPEAFLRAFLVAAGLARPVLVVPSMSGRFALPLLASWPDLVRGFVAVAPAGAERYADRLRGTVIPALVVWGTNDTVLPHAGAEVLAGVLQNAEVVLIEGAGHACYRDRPEEFQRSLLGFLERVGASAAEA